jgi:hypothetical protein
MFELIGDLVRGMGLPWSGAAYLVIVALILFFVSKIALNVALYSSYMLVFSLRRANVRPPAVIYAAETVMYNLLRRLRTGLWLMIALVVGWVCLYLARGSLDGEKVVALERHVTAVVASWVRASSGGS